MAYNDYMDYGVGVESEEERRRREEEERLRAQSSAGGGLDLAGIANRYVDQRLGQAEQRLSDIGQLYTDPGAALEKRLGMTPEAAANTEVQSQTVKTYVDGSQEEITKRQIPAQQPVAAPGPVAPQPAVQPQPVAQAPAAPAAPAPAAPAAPAPAQAAQTQDPAEIQRRAEALRAMTRQAPAAPQAPAPAAPQPELQAQGPINPAAPVPNIGQVPTPGPGVQVAGPTQMPPAATPTGQPQVPTPAAAPSLAQAGAQAQAAMMTPEERQQQAIIAAHNETDPAKRRQMFAQILGGDTTEGNKALANKYIAEDYIKQRNIREAEQKIAEATPTELARYMKEQKKEGSYVKAILLARLGLTDLARREQELISPELKMETAVVGPDKYTVVRDSRGGIERAFDINGNRVGQETIAKISAAALPTKAHLLPSVHGTPVVKEVNGQQVGGLRMYDPQTQSTYVQVGNQRMPDIGWITPGQAPGAVYTAAGAKAQGTAAGEGFTPTPLPARPDTTPATAEDQAMITRLQGDVAGANREIATLSRLPANDPTKQQRIAIVTQERDKAQQRLQQLGGAIQGLTPGGGQVGGIVGGTVAEQKKNLAVAEAAQKKFATDTAEDRAAIANNQGAAESKADYLLTKIDNLLTHPGFETSVGRKGLSYGFGLSKEPLLEGTDASDWQAMFAEVKGNAFTQAVEVLRGLGAMSNYEASAATNAIERLRTSTSEKEFKAAAQDFKDVVQRKIDNNRAKLGQEPKYGTPPASEKAAAKEPVAKLSREDTKALEWARQNPNDERAEKIKRRLGL